MPSRAGHVPVRPALPVLRRARRRRRPRRSSGWTRGSCSPHSRTVTLASSPPTGTSGSAGLGMRRRDRRGRPRPSASSASSRRSVRRRPSTRPSARRPPGRSASAPARTASPIAFEARLRSALSRSPSASSSRRRASSGQRLIDERRILALVDAPLADRVRVLAQPLQPDAHALASAARRRLRRGAQSLDHERRLETGQQPARPRAVRAARGTRRRWRAKARPLGSPRSVGDREDRAPARPCPPLGRSLGRQRPRARRGSAAGRARVGAHGAGSRVGPDGDPGAVRGVRVQPAPGGGDPLREDRVSRAVSGLPFSAAMRARGRRPRGSGRAAARWPKAGR